MGLSGGSKCIFISSKLTSLEFSCILEDRYNDNIHLKDSCTVRRPTVDIDANEVAFRYLNTAIGPAGTVFEIAKALSCLGIDVVLVGDPDNFRYDTKRATIERKAKRERARLHCINNQAKLSQLLQNSPTINPIEINTLEKEISTKKNETSRKLPLDFYDVLHNLVNNYVPELNIKGYINFIVDEKAQADVVIAARVTRKLNDMIVSSDTDFAAYLGNECTCLKDFKYNSRTKTISEFVLYTAADIETYRWSLVLDWDTSTDRQLLHYKAEFPIFEHEDDPNVRAICAVAMGCDVWPRGIKSCGPSKIKNYLDNISVSDKNRAMSIVTSLLKENKSKQAVNKDMLCCYADAFQYEKSTIYGYVHGCDPKTIESYLTDFAGKDTKITNTMKVSYCVGVMSGDGHYFVEAEGSLQCSSCLKVICHFCSGSHHKPLVMWCNVV